MKNRRFQQAYRANASKLHRAVGDCLRNDKPFGEFEWYQEYPVNKVNKEHSSGRHKFDWVCPALRIVIECHGIQHYKISTFGDMTTEEAIDAFHAGKKRDEEKKMAALDANYTYMVVPYTMEKSISSAMLKKLFSLGLTELSIYTKDNKERLCLIEERRENEFTKVFKKQKKEQDKLRRKEHLASDRHQETLRKAREYAQQRYRKLKELKNAR